VAAPTLQKVAESAGVSKMAVSVVLNGARSNTRVSPETRERILRAADDLGYRRNALARSLRTGRTNVVGFYSGHNTLNARTPFLAEIIGGAQDACDEAGKDLLLFGKFRGKSAEDVFQAIADGRIDGLVVHAPPGDKLVEQLRSARFPAVGVVDAIPGLTSVVVDDEAGGRLQAELLASVGHRCVLYRPSLHPYVSAARREAAFRTACAKLGVEVREGRRTSYRGDEVLSDEERALLRGPDAPTAAVCWEDGGAYTLLSDLAQKGIRLAVLGFNGMDPYCPPAWDLTTVRAPWADVARTAVSRLVDLLAGQEVPLETRLPVELARAATA
jgi:DNA-binding LacI/PurR family transcriptional regulator